MVCALTPISMCDMLLEVLSWSLHARVHLPADEMETARMDRSTARGAQLLLSIFLFAATLQAQSSFAIENVTLIDGTGRSAIANACVVVSGDKILRAGPCPIAA